MTLEVDATTDDFPLEAIFKSSVDPFSDDAYSCSPSADVPSASFCKGTREQRLSIRIHKRALHSFNSTHSTEYIFKNQPKIYQ